MKKYFIITYGCQMQKADSERIAAVLEKMSYKKTSHEEEADLIMVNMCSIRQSAVDRIYGKIKNFAKLKTQNSKLKTILTGCISKKDFEKFKDFFDFVLPIKTLPQWPRFLRKEKFFYFPDQRQKSFIEKVGCGYLKIEPKYSKKFSIFVPISTGCNNFCSFCIVPFVRGPLICRDHREIIKEVKKAVKNGAKEIWLLGQNVNDYKSYLKAQSSKLKTTTQSSKLINFAKLLKMVNEVPGNFWIRFTSPYPKNFSNELIQTMANCQKVTPYLNLPLQSGDDEILKRMNRPYTIKQYQNLVKKIRQAFKKYRKGIEREIAISTDIIVGFPGETKKQFQNTVNLFKEIKFDMAYIAQYSPRPGTAAAKMKDNVSRQEKERREKELTEILKKTALENNEKYIGKEVEVLVNESRIKNNNSRILIGKSRHYKTVKIEDTKYRMQNTKLVGKFIKAKIVGATPWGLKSADIITKCRDRSIL